MNPIPTQQMLTAYSSCVCTTEATKTKSDSAFKEFATTEREKVVSVQSEMSSSAVNSGSGTNGAPLL